MTTTAAHRLITSYRRAIVRIEETMADVIEAESESREYIPHSELSKAQDEVIQLETKLMEALTS